MEADTSEPSNGIELEAHPAASSSNNIHLNDYKGYEPPSGVSSTIDRVSADISPQEFFEKYIQARKPVIIEQHLTDASWKGSLWSSQYLKEKAGKAEVLVEKRTDEKDGMFGLSAPKVHMKYGEFLDHLDNKSEQYYLTTQDLERFQNDLDDFDMPKSVLAEPLKSLKGDFPLSPSLLGKLVPYQVSLWQGNSAVGSSSGLHHDFHDNLYVLMRGRKRFRLFPPSLAPNMSTMGCPIKIHSNGLIVYQSQSINPTVNVRADGVPLAFLARRKRIEAEQELAIAEEEMYSIQDSTGLPEAVKKVEIKRLQGIILDCEDRIDLAMEEMLQYGNTFDYDYNSDNDVISVHGDDSELDEEEGHKETSQKAVQIDEADKEQQPPTKVMRLANGSRAIVKSSQSGEANGESEDILKIPDHFCNIVLSKDTDDTEELLSKFPKKEAISCLCIAVKSGEMLYLPASWFHEVTSYSDDSASSETDVADLHGHLALNYWMFPPDGDTFDLPYRDDFWPKRWEAIQEEKDEIFTVGNKSKYSRALDSGDVISLDSDSDEDVGDNSSDSLNAILVADDSLHDFSNENDDPIVIEGQACHSLLQDGTIELDTSADLSSCAVTAVPADNGKPAENSKESDISDGILDSSDEEDKEAEIDKCAGGDSLRSSEVLADLCEADGKNKTEKNFAEVDSNAALESTENHASKTGSCNDSCKDTVQEPGLIDAAQEHSEATNVST